MLEQGPKTWVKICGTTNLRDAELSMAAGADALGFIFAASPRQVRIDTAAKIVAALPRHIETVGVFVNETAQHVAEVVEEVGLSGVQLHGEEDPVQMSEFCRVLTGRRIIKALSTKMFLRKDKAILEQYLCLSGRIDAILLDSGTPQKRGGTGVPFEWEQAVPVARGMREKMPLIIAGGLNAENVGRAIEMFQPFGVDVVSGVESTPGEKDERKLRDFITAVRDAKILKAYQGDHGRDQ